MARQNIKQRPVAKFKAPANRERYQGRKWGWIGHTLRREKENIAKHAMDWNP